MIKIENSRNEESVSWRSWLAVVALGVSSFAIVTTELAPMGLLSPLAVEFGQTEGKAGMIGSIGAQLVPARKVGLATSIIFGRVSVASVLGVPLANLLTQLDGWRTAFMVIAALSLAATLAIALTVPRLPASTTIGVDALADVLRNRRFRRIYLATGCAITAHFAAFTFIEPFLSNALNTRVNLISTLLLVFGAGALMGGIVLSMTSLSGLMVIAAVAIAASLVPVMLIESPVP